MELSHKIRSMVASVIRLS